MPHFTMFSSKDLLSQPLTGPTWSNKLLRMVFFRFQIVPSSGCLFLEVKAVFFLKILRLSKVLIFF